MSKIVFFNTWFTAEKSTWTIKIYWMMFKTWIHGQQIELLFKMCVFSDINQYFLAKWFIAWKNTLNFQLFLENSPMNLYLPNDKCKSWW